LEHQVSPKVEAMMAGLPPYSTFRTDTKQMMFPQATSHGNILTFTPPGFQQSLNVKFPDSRLPVCEKCKKNFKTKDMCRVRNTHTSAPWTTAYICITIDETCTDENGKYMDTPMTLRMVQWQAFQVQKPFDSKTPVCAACKRTNRTKNFCRDRHKHRQLPWCTVYVLLSAADQTDPSTIVAGTSKKLEDLEGGDSTGNADKGESKENVSSPASTEKPKEVASSPVDSAVGSDTITSEAVGDTDDINDIAESRTFLAKVSSAGSTIHWLELADYEGGDGQAMETPPEPIPPHYMHGQPQVMDPNIPPVPYYPPYSMPHHHHQQSQAKSHQQYFFHQMQQQQQRHQYMPPPPQHGHWPMYAMGAPQHSGEMMHPHVTAGEAAAAQQRRSVPDESIAGHHQQHLQHQQAWQHYYQQQQHHQQNPYSIQGAEGGIHPGPYHSPPESDNGDSDMEGGPKRQRTSL
jgi:hypothetical protein